MIKKRYKVLIGEPERIAIILVGVGGTGSFAALNVARLMASHPDKRITLTLVDPDYVEHKNVGRQYFCPADIGAPKAGAIANRLNLAFALAIVPVVRPISTGILKDAMPVRGLTLVVGCVDTPAARRDIAQALEALDHDWTGRSLWWLDAGNDNISGQILIGNSNGSIHPSISEFGECTGLPYPSVQEPALLAEPIELAPDLSCADLVALEVQARTINYMMAAWLDVYIERLLISGDLDIMRTVINQRSGQAHSTPITNGVVAERDVRIDRPILTDDEVDPCPECGYDLVTGIDVVDGEEAGVIYCPECDWLISLEE